MIVVASLNIALALLLALLGAYVVWSNSRTDKRFAEVLESLMNDTRLFDRLVNATVNLDAAFRRAEKQTKTRFANQLELIERIELDTDDIKDKQDWLENEVEDMGVAVSDLDDDIERVCENLSEFEVGVGSDLEGHEALLQDLQDDVDILKAKKGNKKS